MRTSILTLLSLLFCLTINAQNAKIAYIELGGPGIISANYDMRFSQKEDGLGGRIGVGGYSLNDGFNDRISLLTVPVGLNYLLSKDGKNYFEIGAGFTYLKVGAGFQGESTTLESSFGNLTFGYRLAPSRGGFVFKAQITPIFNKYGFVPYWGGIGFGYKF
ncbi:MAG: hypothetical protein ABI266_03905 [Ginsengibacter sp.]